MAPTASSAAARAFCARPARLGPRTGVTGLARGDPVAPPGKGITGFELRPLWPQDHRTPGGLADRRAVELRAGLAHPMLQPGHHERHRARRRQRVHPKIAIPPAGTTTTPVLKHDQPLAVSIPIRPRA